MEMRKISRDKLALAANQNKKEREFWLEKLAGEPVKSNFPFDFRKKNRAARNMSIVTSRFPESLFTQLMKLCKSSDHALNVILNAGLVGLLRKYTNADDIIFGAPIYKQDINTELINTLLVLRYHIDEDVSFKQLLGLAKQTIVEATEHYSYPIELLPDKLNLPVTEGEFPLFDIVILLRNIHDKSYIRYISPKIIFSFYRGDNYLEMEVEYDSLLYAETTIKRIIRHYSHLLQSVMFNVNLVMTQIDILPEEDKKQILNDFNDTAKTFPGDKGVPELFEEQVERTPDCIALVGAKHSDSAGNGNASPLQPVYLTYRELNRKSNQLALLLREKGVKPDTIVGVMVERSSEMITAIYAVLKAGAAYLPIDPAYPPERVRYMLADSDSRFLLTQGKFTGNGDLDLEGEVLDVFDESLYRDRQGGQNPGKVTTAENLFYMIYTSGSTGKPKGAMIKIRGFVNLLHWFNTEFTVDSRDCVLLAAPVSFDLTQKNLFSPLLKGGILCLSSPGLPDYYELSHTIAREKVTIVNVAPSVFYPLVELNEDEDFRMLKPLRYVFLGGEPIRGDKLAPWLNAENCRCELVNTYGPTECTDIVASYRVSKADIAENKNIPIGKPIYNVSLFVLDKNRQVLPIGVMGELCIGGIGLSKGYHKNPQLNTEKFVDTPGLTVKKVYRTGDMVRWLEDGNIEFLGRVDHQVKVRGNRIELGEIENRLSNFPSVKEAVVTATADDSGENQLCAYIVFAGAGDGINDSGITQLKEYLSRELPDYMIPPYFVPLETLPLTPSGKVDRNALPPPGLMTGRTYTAPRDGIEKKLVEIWTEVLFGSETAGISLSRGPGIGIDDDFFQLGGHSLKGTVVLAKIHKAFDIRITLAELFKTPNIRGVSALVKKGVRDQYFSIAAVEKRDYYELSSAQKRLYIMMQVEYETTSYNMPMVYQLKTEEKPDINKWQKVFKKLIHWHESFRTSFIMLEDEPVQRVHSTGDMEFEIKNVAAERRVQGAVTAGTVVDVFSGLNDLLLDLVRPFDLSKAPLLRAWWINTGETVPLLMVDMHHIISDGISIQLFQKELIALYNSENVSPLRIQYKDFSQWHKKESQDEKIKKQEDFWLQEFTGEIPILELPLDYTRPPVQNFAGDSLSFSLNEQQAELLNSMAREENVTLFMLLFAVFNIFLSKLSGQEDIVVGTPAAGRRHTDLDKIIGMFINTLALRSQLESNETFVEFLSRVREKVLLAFENQEYQFEELVGHLIKSRDTSRNPIFDVMFVVQNIEQEKLKAPGIELVPYEYNLRISKFDMSLFVIEDREKPLFIIEYCTKLFKKATIEQFVGYFKEILSKVLDNKEIKLEDIKLAYDLFDQKLDNPEIDFSF